MQQGTTFSKQTEGLTMSGFGKISRTYEIEEQLPSGNYSCKVLFDNTVPRINPIYREHFNEEQITKLIENEK